MPLQPLQSLTSSKDRLIGPVGTSPPDHGWHFPRPPASAKEAIAVTLAATQRILKNVFPNGRVFPL